MTTAELDLRNTGKRLGVRIPRWCDPKWSSLSMPVMSGFFERSIAQIVRRNI